MHPTESATSRSQDAAASTAELPGSDESDPPHPTIQPTKSPDSLGALALVPARGRAGRYAASVCGPSGLPVARRVAGRAGAARPRGDSPVRREVNLAYQTILLHARPASSRRRARGGGAPVRARVSVIRSEVAPTRASRDAGRRGGRFLNPPLVTFGPLAV
jgi:hypothetical protein